MLASVELDSNRDLLYVVRKNGSKINDHQIDRTIDLLGLNDRVLYCGVFSLLRFFLLYIWCLKKTLGRGGCVYVGDARGGYSILFAIGFWWKRQVLIDDGIATLSYIYRRLNKNSVGMVKMGSLKPVMTNVFRCISPSYDLFTAIPLEPREFPNCRVHCYEKTESLFKASVVDESMAVFVGSKVVEAGLLSMTAFEDSVNKFLNENSGRSCVYAAHRAEMLDKLEPFKGKMSVEVFSLPIELHYLNLGRIPKFIGGFYSGALVFFKKATFSVMVRNYSIAKTKNNSAFHDEIVLCDAFFNRLNSGECVSKRDLNGAVC